MGQVLYGSATTTEAVRRAIQHSQASLRELAGRYGVTPKTIAKWRKRTSVADRPTGPREARSAAGKLYLFVAINRTSKFAFVQLVDSATRVTASAFLEALVAAVRYRIHTVLTDNSIQFRFAPRYADGPAARYMTHMFAMRCQEHGIEHRFTRINHPCWWAARVLR